MKVLVEIICEHLSSLLKTEKYFLVNGFCMLFIQVGLFYCHLVVLGILNLHLCIGFKALKMFFLVCDM